VLVKEYIDDGITGILLDRPALEELRQDAKTDLFDRTYFHAADRIAREAAHQTIIIGELVKRGKQITVGGKEYEATPEGKLTLNMLGLFSEYVRQFCANANGRLLACGNFDDKREYLQGHVERVIYYRYDVAIVGSVPLQSASGDTKLPFRIKGTIDIKAVRSESCRKAALEQLRAEAAEAAAAKVENAPTLPAVSRYAEAVV
jgi:hypothetical protein